MYLVILLLRARGPRLQLFEEVVALVVYEDECGEILNGDFPNSLHTQFGIFHTLDALDAALRQNGSHASDGAEIETSVLLTSICYHVAAIALGYHHETCTVVLELIYVWVHAVGSGRSH